MQPWRKAKIPVCRAFSWNFMGVLQLRARYKPCPIFEPYKQRAFNPQNAPWIAAVYRHEAASHLDGNNAPPDRNSGALA